MKREATTIRFIRHLMVLATLAVVAGSAVRARAADLSVADLSIQSGTTATLVVSGSIAGEVTFGVTVVVEIVPRPGNVGTLTFTTAPPVDVTQAGDAWPGAGTFTPLDTDQSGSVLLNGTVDDSGAGAGPVTFSGALSNLPIIASADAIGVWDVFLTTAAATSSWEGLANTLTSGTVSVFQGECAVALDCDDLVACTDESCVAATCIFTPNDLNCIDDGVFCNGVEVCDAVLDCVSPGDPCAVGTFCNETTSACDECVLDTDCNDAVPCTDDTCVLGSCVFTANDLNCTDNGVFCDGLETCDAALGCASSGSPCLASQICDEVADACVACTLDAECDDGNICTDDTCNAGSCVLLDNTAPCDDGLFCTLTDICTGGACAGGGESCPGQVCDEAQNSCIGAFASMTVGNSLVDPGSLSSVVVAGRIGGFNTFGLNLFVELVPRPGGSGTVVFTPAPPADITQLDDAWPGIGTFSIFDTDVTASALLNGAIDDNGTFAPSPVSFDGQLAAFPVVASVNAGGVWDVLLSTAAGDSGWEGVTTTLNAGTITINPGISLFVSSLAMPPGATTDIVVGGEVQSGLTFGETILLELIPRAGNVGTLAFTAAPPADVRQLDDPWPGVGTFTAFDSDTTGSTALNGVVDDNGSFILGVVDFLGDLAAFPVTASAGAAGVWDVTLTTGVGTSSWESLNTVLIDGTVNVTPGACVLDIDCDDVNTCTTDVCNAGICEHTTVVGACDDGDLCTQSDTCSGTTCIGVPTDCTSLDGICALGFCDAATGLCVAAPANEGGACDDVDACTLGDVCVSGVCAGTATDCTSLDDACNLGACNASTGGCFASPINEAGICDDLDPCTATDVCTNGACAGAPIPGCVNCTLAPDCDDANVCTGDSCVGGVCQYVNLVDLCDDGDPCTSADVCSGGACAGTVIVGCQNCVTDPDCDDANVCTSDACVGGACQRTDLTVACNDGDRCTVGDACSGGTCAGATKDCSVLTDACNIGTCTAATGVCLPVPTNEGGICDDGLSCTINDVCTTGTCGGTFTGTRAVDLVLVPGSPSVQVGQIVSVAVVATSRTCVDEPVGAAETILTWDSSRLQLVGRTRPAPTIWINSFFPDDSGLDRLNDPFSGIPDNDGDALWQGIHSFQTGVSIPPAGRVIVTFEFLALDGAVATPVAFAPTFGSFTQTRVLAASPFAGLDLTGTLGSATVQVIECQLAAECDDGNLCTTDLCVSGVCQNNNNAVACDDGLFCTTGDVCSGGTCGGTSSPCVSPAFCSETLDACVACLADAHCNDGNVCTTDVCTGAGACQITNNTLNCDDGFFCTLTDQCSGGACVGTGTTCPGAVCDEPGDRCVECLVVGDCADGNPCTTDSCVGNLCQNANNTLPCTDGLFCTTGDVCSNGACIGGPDPCVAPTLCSEVFDACVPCLTDPDCDDGNLCTTDTCLFGTCSNTNNVAPCDDGDFCTATDVCTGGVCVGGGDPCPGRLCDGTGSRCVDCFTLLDCPNDNVACTVDSCTNGLCRHTPNDVACNDGLFCTGNEVCNPVTGCFSVGNPCDDPTLCNEAGDLCGCSEPIVFAEGGRYIGVTPRPGATPVAIRIAGVNPEVACVDMYVASNGTLSLTPVFKTPGGSNGWNTVHVRDAQIRPNTSYVIRTECETGQGVGQSTLAAATTWRWGDTDNSGGLVDVVDITILIDAFEGVFLRGTLEGSDLWGTGPSDCRPQRVIDVQDLTRIIDAFSGAPFLCASPCP